MFDPIMYAMMKKNGGGLPVVEITSAWYDPETPTKLTKAESDALTAAAESASHVIVDVIPADGFIAMPCLCKAISMDGILGVTGAVATFLFIANRNDDGIWEMGG